ncbi:MAG: hypothetical protein AMJ66_06625 [Betaproteobacteria bacterium SG8_40]|jgi:hypothetical protein|nr:MAG: hypothetical protein AMJ66_06625 [Betaproteobacteria bacterium SG8_40]
MTIDDYIASLKKETFPPGLPAPLQALWHEARGDWESAHKIVQGEDTAEAAWVHAFLHRKEGDAANAAYWYRRSKRPVSTDSLDSEWRSIAGDLLASGNVS